MTLAAYLDCFSGISGDMLLGALLDAGLPPAGLKDSLDRLALSGYRLEISPAADSAIKAARVRVVVEEPQPHRRLPDIENILAAGSLDPSVGATAREIFHRLAAAEAAVHDCGLNEVHFHEVGGVDAMVDVVGAVSGFHLLGITDIYASPLPMPGGWVRCAHGELPVPAPAVCELLRGVPVYGEAVNQELVTPTGAAIIRVLAREFGPMPPMRITGTGYGAGSRTRLDGRPNLLRLITGERFSPAEAQTVDVIETGLDDWSPETWPHVAEKLLAGGALDVALVPIQMKKGRPGFLLRIICDPSSAEAVKNIIFRETSAIGLRYHSEQRRTLPREAITLQTRWGPVLAKKILSPDGPVIRPEYEECRRLAGENGIPIRAVYDEVARCAAASSS
jgi:pyridinium-3,5-bisthiocarboxylic acid mononucleotide nickel chelatase